MTTPKLIVAAVAGSVLAATAQPVQAGHGCGSENSKPTRVAFGGSGRKKDIVDTAVAAGSFNTLAAALKAAGLVDALKGDGPFTVFAPTDKAFGKLPDGTVEMLLEPHNKPLLTAILTYHVVPGRLEAEDVVRRTAATTLNGQRIDFSVGEGVRVDNAGVVKTDIACSNGVIHVIDAVIMPSTDSILETAAKAGSFETLAAAIKAAGLAELLSGKGPFTVFAPTDAAFATLPPGTLDRLLKPANRHQLIDLLKYHVVPGRVYASDALAAGTAVTAAGSRVRFGVGNGRLMINGADIVQPDIEATNGVIHVIDEVLVRKP